ncbi:hypothetical protein GLOIN_2v1784962 [Rhizophagus clarus]|uniref:F-box domain-containing protein n=1 Tax=Rhizophagus clarus TaxID=94130 RepID=A0A8H3LE03_9GLOM|nr:hypothetical protein GLOIN_2v1784962 [Rhizophagus clarus]
MLQLNKDILYLIFKELQNDKRSLFSCLTVDRNWCETTVPILWRNPWKLKRKILSNVIISHLSDESIENLKSHVREEIFNLFINENMRFTHLFIPQQLDYQIHLIPGARLCFSELEFLSCNTRIDDEVFIGLIEICKSVKELELTIEMDNNNYEIVKLIKATNRLFNIRLLIDGYDESFCKLLEDSLIKHANSMRYFKLTRQPATKIISSFTNLNKLELSSTSFDNMTTWNCLNNLSLPFLQILKARCIPVKVLTDLIKNTSGHLAEIKIDNTFHDEINNKNIIQAIYKNCLKLKYLKLLIKNSNILELEILLVNCQYLNRLYIITQNEYYLMFNWNHLFEVLTKSSPTSLFGFKFCFNKAPRLESLKLFLDNWKNRHSMLLKTFLNCYYMVDRDWSDEHLNLIEKYKTQGVVEKYDHVSIRRFTVNDPS